jgi:hypothetical protein
MVSDLTNHSLSVLIPTLTPEQHDDLCYRMRVSDVDNVFFKQHLCEPIRHVGCTRQPPVRWLANYSMDAQIAEMILNISSTGVVSLTNALQTVVWKTQTQKKQTQTAVQWITMQLGLSINNPYRDIFILDGPPYHYICICKMRSLGHLGLYHCRMNAPKNKKLIIDTF